jgi:hypothetical protein
VNALVSIGISSPEEMHQSVRSSLIKGTLRKEGAGGDPRVRIRKAIAMCSGVVIKTYERPHLAGPCASAQCLLRYPPQLKLKGDYSSSVASTN